jgi:SnoaL-like protein
MPETCDFVDKQAIRELVENSLIWRDARMWDRLRTAWHPDGIMMATWFQGTIAEFIEANRVSYERGFRTLHFLGGLSIDVNGDRAISQAQTTVSQRDVLGSVLCDVICTTRFYDFLERRNGRWGLVLRQPIYERDRLDPVDPAVNLALDRKLLEQFPEGYRHLAYLQTQNGYNVKMDMPGPDGPEVETLYARGGAWLAGRSS